MRGGQRAHSTSPLLPSVAAEMLRGCMSVRTVGNVTLEHAVVELRVLGTVRVGFFVAGCAAEGTVDPAMRPAALLPGFGRSRK